MDADVVVIGAGVAGSASALALARIGLTSLILHDPDRVPASAVPLAVMAPYTVPPRDPMMRLRARGAVYTRALLARLGAAGLDSGLRHTGALLVPANARERRRQASPSAATGGTAPQWLTPRESASRHGVEPPEAAVFHPLGACIDPAVFCRAMRLMGGERIRTETAAVHALSRVGNRWQVLDRAGCRIAEATQLLLAAGPACASLYPALGDSLVPVRGQATAFAATGVSSTLRVPVSHGGYVTPAVGGCHWAGGTAQRGDSDPRAREQDDTENRARVAALWAADAPVEIIDRFVAIRASTTDRLPRIGPLERGLWINAGHGAHGLMTAPLGGHFLASALTRRQDGSPASVSAPTR